MKRAMGYFIVGMSAGAALAYGFGLAWMTAAALGIGILNAYLAVSRKRPAAKEE